MGIINVSIDFSGLSKKTREEIAKRLLKIDRPELIEIDSDSDVKEALASNANVSGNILKKLAHDQEVFVRVSVALNPYTDSETLSDLSKDPDSNVRIAAARNLKTPIEDLERMEEIDQCYDVRIAARNTLQQIIMISMAR